MNAKPLDHYFSTEGFAQIEPFLSLVKDCVSDSELVRWIEHLNDLIEAFNQVVVPGYIDPFQLEDVVLNLVASDVWGCSIIKRQDKKVLYGVQHVDIRQQFWNTMPYAMRLAIFQEKVKTAKISYQLNAILDRATQLQSLVLDVWDIGKADPIYKIDIRQGAQSCAYVLKQGWSNSQRFFEAVCTIFGKAIIASYPLFSKTDAFTLLNYLPGKALHELNVSDIKADDMIDECAFQAAIGDCLGRGDRHFENYLWANHHLYPLDISYMFDPDHRLWLKRYTAAGMYEVNSVVNNKSDSNQVTVSEFYQRYRYWMTQIDQRKEELYQVVGAYFPGETKRFCTYIDQSVQQTESYIQIYEEGLIEYQEHQAWRTRLEALVQKEGDILEQYPILKMMHLAHEHRPIAFYQKDNLEEDLWSLIEKLESKLG